MRNHQRVLIIGASGRFLAQSSVFAGCQVSVVDLFADEDTRQFCAASNRFLSSAHLMSTARRIDAVGDLASIGKKSNGKVLHALGLETGSSSYAIVFSGGGENYPEFFRLGFWGCSEVAGPAEDSIAGLLQWSAVTRICRAYQIKLPRSFDGQDAGLRIDGVGSWLKKRVRSGGGLQIQTWDSSCKVALEAGCYLQEVIQGTTLSGCFVSCDSDGRSSTCLLGVCQQLPNETPGDYRYRGSRGPINISEADYQEIERVGRSIASELNLSGVWGIDFIVSSQGLFLIDINPRVTASAELIERFYRRIRSDFTILGTHLEAAIGGRIPTPLRGFGGFAFSKAIVYLDSAVPLIVDEAMNEFFWGNSWITDIPSVGTKIQPGHPIVTVHAGAENQRALEAKSIQRISKVRAITRLKIC